MFGLGALKEQCLEDACSGPLDEEQIVTSRLQSDFLRMDHVVQQFGQRLFQADLTQAVISTVPFELVLAGIWSLVAFCLRYRRARKNTATSQQFAARFRYYLAASRVRYLIPIGIAATFYVLLSYYIYLFQDSINRRSPIAMQLFFKRVSEFFFHYFKLSEYAILAILVAIYVLSCVLLSKQLPGDNEEGVTAGAGDWLRFRERLVATLYRSVDVYSKYSGPVAFGLATLASFTFFGMQLREPAKDLQLQVNYVDVGYAEVTKRTEAELSERVTIALYAKIRDTFPSSYQEALKLPTDPRMRPK